MEAFTWILLSILVLFAVILVARSVKIIKQSETMVVERLGKYDRTLDSGLNVIFPLIEKPRKIKWKFTRELEGRTVVEKRQTARLDLRETVYDFPEQSVITKDNVSIEINAMIYFQITDAKNAVYEIDDLPNAIENLTRTTLRNVAGEMELDEILSSRDEINTKLRGVLDEATDKWGVKVNRVEIQDIIPPEDVKQAMEKQMRAERDRRANILESEGKKKSDVLEAEGKKEAEINKAEGEKEAQIKVAEGEAEAIAKVAEAIGEAGGDPTEYLIATKYLDKLEKIATDENDKVVFLPYEATGILGSLGGIKELFTDEDIDIADKLEK
jgi:regulator of protease activity HflC (stomatin/prohibitin superfamily)